MTDRLLLVFFLIYNSIFIKANKVCLIDKYESVENATKFCKNIVLNNFVVPGGRTLNLTLLEGSILTFQGNVTFEFKNWEGPLIRITGNNLTVSGTHGHIINGHGELYWDGLGSWGSIKPRLLFVQANNSLFEHLHFRHTPVHAIRITNSTNVTFSHIFIDNAAANVGVAPVGHEGHNTDGFGVQHSHNITIQDSTIYNQDDCVVLNSGRNIHVTNLLCHGSHGLSLSVGQSNYSREANTLTDVIIENSVIIDAMDGIHIKTHPNAAKGSIRNITYRNILMVGSYQYGIAIEQNYTNTLTSVIGTKPSSNILIENLQFENIKGSVLNTSMPYYIVCAEGGCLNWKWTDIDVYGIKKSACVNFHPDFLECVDYKLQ
uniref:endo-polygalacturonase n=1 Tax=Sitophilus oryzae TaxID=7048 RepID=E7CIP6_SITOR|nr:endopolygalacturonase [Sitophilus oryzae]